MERDGVSFINGGQVKKRQRVLMTPNGIASMELREFCGRGKMAKSTLLLEGLKARFGICIAKVGQCHGFLKQMKSVAKSLDTAHVRGSPEATTERGCGLARLSTGQKMPLSPSHMYVTRS